MLAPFHLTVELEVNPAPETAKIRDVLPAAMIVEDKDDKVGVNGVSIVAEPPLQPYKNAVSKRAVVARK